MALVARVVRSNPRNERAPENLIWAGRIIWEPDSKPSENPGSQYLGSALLSCSVEVWSGSRGMFLTGPSVQEAYMGDDGQPRVRRKKVDGRYLPLVKFGDHLTELAVKAVLAHLEDENKEKDAPLVSAAEKTFGKGAFTADEVSEELF